jgi:hypothetical protein
MNIDGKGVRHRGEKGMIAGSWHSRSYLANVVFVRVSRNDSETTGQYL